MSRTLSIFLAGLLLGGLVATGVFSVVLGTQAGGASVNQARTLKLAHSLDTSHPVHLGMVHLQKRLEELSGGTMKLEIHAGGVLGGETECMEQVQNGVLAMTKTSTGPMEAFVPEMMVFGLPYLFRDTAHFWTFADGPRGKELLHKGANRNMYGLCYYDAGTRNFYTNDRMIRSPEDLKGLKIRVMNSPTAIKMVEMLGASPTPISWGELYSALSQGIVDGAENNPPSFYSNKHYETCKHLSLDAHVMLPDILLINTGIWQNLSPQEQQWLQQAADESSAYQREVWAAKTAEALEAVGKLGVEVYEPDKKPFMEKVAPMYDEYTGTPIGELAEHIRDIP